MIDRLIRLWKHFQHHEPIHRPVTVHLETGEKVEIKDRRSVHIKRILFGRGK